MYVRTIVVAAIITAATLSSSSVRAYCLYPSNSGSKCEGWGTTTIKYRVSSNLTDPNILSAINAAFATWQAVTCTNLSFQKDADFPIGTAMSAGSGYISIYWVTQASEVPSGMTADSYAYWYHGYNPSGERTLAAVALNGYKYKWNTTGGANDTFDVQNVMTHFVGLMLALDYSKTAGAVMYNDLAYGQTSKRTLTQDDVNAVSALYRGTCATPPGIDVACGVSCTVGPVGGDGVKRDGGANPSYDGKAPAGKEGGTSPQYDGAITGCNPQCQSDEICTYQQGSFSCVKSGSSDSGCSCLIAGQPDRGLATLSLLAIAAMAMLLLARRRS